MTFHFDNMYCGLIRRGDVFVCDRGDGEFAVVVLQDTTLNDGLPSVVCARIEPKKKDDIPLVNEVLLKQFESGLGIDGICLTHKIETINRHHMTAKKAELSPERIQEIFQAFDITLGRFRDRHR